MIDNLKEIIEKARQFKLLGMDDLNIAKFVQVELGKEIVYDNSYTKKLTEN